MLYIDVECYSDYFLLNFHNEEGKNAAFEMFEGKPLDVSRIASLMASQTTLGFNSNNYDIPMIAAALENRSCAELKELSDEIITSGRPAWQIVRNREIPIPRQWDHIDIIEIPIGQVGLKIYGARLGFPKLQELPFDPSASITPEQRPILRAYCANDCAVTKALADSLQGQIALRADMSKQYGVDLRSKSDAQIAEAVLRHEIEEIKGSRLIVPKVDPKTTYRYQDPAIIAFDTPELQTIFDRILAHPFGLAANGSIEMPDWLKQTKIKIGRSEYQMGIGGLHSCEKSQTVRAGSSHILADFDVASYYPSIILQQRIAPETMGDDFLTIYQGIVDRRLAAKRSGDKLTANTLKIVVNGSFGKLGSKYSTLYAPNLMIQTTITGQLALLMLIERVEAIGASVVSANTDGIVIFANKALEPALEQVVFDWQVDTSFELERSDYSALHSRDVNNYIAVKPNGSTKRKGAFGEEALSKNPQFQIVTDAIADHVAGKCDFKETIRNSQDVRKFVMVRSVTGGAVWRKQPIGKAVRFYYSTEVGTDEAIQYAKNGNKVPQSDGAKPLMDLPDTIPSDVDRERYIGMAMIAMKGLGL